MLFIYHGCPGEGRGGQKLCYFLPTIISAYGAVTVKHIPYRHSAVSWLGGVWGAYPSISIYTAMYECPPMGLMMTFTFVLTAQCSLYSFSAFLPLQPFRNWNFILKAHKRGALYILPITVVRPECRWSELHGRILLRADFLYLRQPMKVKDSPISRESRIHFRSGFDRKV